MCVRDGHVCVVRSCIIQGGEMKGREMGGTCRSEERGDKCMGGGGM